MFHSHPAFLHTAETVASSLYVKPASSEKLLSELIAAGIVAAAENGYRYSPRHAELSKALDELFVCYQANLVGITNLVHDATRRSAERFANAFKLRKGT